MEVSGHLHTPSTHWIRGWVGPRAGLDDVKREILHCWEPNPGRPARSYTNSEKWIKIFKFQAFWYLQRLDLIWRDRLVHLSASLAHLCQSREVLRLCKVIFYIYKSDSIWLAGFVCVLLGDDRQLLRSGGVIFGVGQRHNNGFVCVLLGDGWQLLWSGGVFFGVGQQHNNGVTFSLGSVLKTRWWANVVFSFRSVPRLYKEWNSALYFRNASC
jgi:hypothetical protein